MTIAWVVGSGGLLGSALCRALRAQGTKLFLPQERFDWGNEIALTSQFSLAVRAFAARAAKARHWEIYWVAGVGAMGSSEADLVAEIRALSILLIALALEELLMARSGAVALASSAGAIYAGANEEVITERTIPAPTTPYARGKLQQEELVKSFVRSTDKTTALIARISTLYGPGQSRGKKQGLLSSVAHSIITNQPVRIFVPLDTIRDYLASDDAAPAMIAALRTIGGKQRVLTKIIASERPTTIAEIISTYRRIARRSPRIVTSASSLSGVYARRVRFRSISAPDATRSPRISLLVGIAQVMAAERAAHLRSSKNDVR
jgi:UDP-glucose 4-epimerase